MLSAAHNKTHTKGAKAILCLATLFVSGCVSQQSALDFGETPQTLPQPVATGVQLVDSNSSGLASTVVANNIPVKAPRIANLTSNAPTQPIPVATIASPATTIASQPVAPVIQTPNAAEPIIIAQQVAPQAPTVPTTAVPNSATTEALAITNSQTQSPTANVIAQATTQASIVPTKKPIVTTTAQPTSVEVASLSPSVGVAQSVEAPAPQTVKQKSFFEKLFAPQEKKPRPVTNVKKPNIQRATSSSSRIETASLVTKRTPNVSKKPKIKSPKTVITKVDNTDRNSGGALPGVKSNSEIFGIKDQGPTKKKSTTKTTQVASVGSFGRLSPNGLRVQHSKVQVACLKPGVLRILKMVERHYGKKPIITSGYRSPKGNRRAGGARNSQHIFCKAVDIQVEGVSKWKLAKYLRTVPGRGGVGTYCRTKSVHFDIGSKRDWHHPCRKSSKRKRKKT